MATRRTVRKPRDLGRRRRILDTAKRLFVANGFKATTLDAVAAESGCAKGALYLEFADKEALLRCVAQETFAAVRARYAAQVVAIPSPLERLTETLRFAYREMAHEPLFTKLLREDPDLQALGLASSAEAARDANAQVELLASWVKEGIDCGEIRADIDGDSVPVVLGVLRMAPLHLGMMASIGRFSPEWALEAIVDIFRAGLAARPPPKRRPSVRIELKRPKSSRSNNR